MSRFDYHYYNPGRDHNVGFIGPVGAFGVEWMFYENFSLSAEYSVEGRVSYGKVTSYNGSNSNVLYKTKTTINGYSFDSRGVQFGLSAFF